MLHRLSGCVAMAALLFVGAAAAGRGPTEWTIDPSASRVVILVGKAGLLSVAGHAHEVLAPLVGGRVVFDPGDPQRASVALEFDASALKVTGKGESATDVPEVQRVMLSAQVLDAARYPTIAFQSRRIAVTTPTAASANVQIEGEMTLHGVTRPVTVRAAVTLDAAGGLTARGSFVLKQTDFGMVPVAAAGGTIRVKDELEVQFVLKASARHDADRAH